MMLERVAAAGALLASAVGFIAQEISELPDLLDPALRYGSPLALLWGAIHLVRLTYRSATELGQEAGKEAHERADQWAQELVATAKEGEAQAQETLARREQEWAEERARLLAQIADQDRETPT